MYSLILIIFAACLVIGVPIAFSMGGLGILWSLFTGNELTLVARRMYYGVDSFTLLAVPLFMLSATLMNSGDLSSKLVEFCRVFFGRFKGGLAYINIVASMLFAGMSGSSQADTAGIGGILMPEMEKEGYPADITTGVTAASSTIGVIIPPSIPMLVMGSVVSISVAGMFLGGLLPGIIVGLMQCVQIYVMSKRHHFPSTKTYSFHESMRMIWRGIPALIIPVIIVGGTGLGIFTSTEASVVCVFYALFVGLISRQLNIKKIWKALKDIAVLSSIPLLICSVGFPLGWIMAYEGIPQALSEGITSFTSSPIVVMGLIGMVVLAMGCFVDNIVIISIMAPILYPVAISVGIHPIHFAIVFVVGSAIGLITPPVGQCLFVCSTVSKNPLGTVIKGTVPFLIGELAVYFLLIIFPAISTIVPQLFL